MATQAIEETLTSGKIFGYVADGPRGPVYRFGRTRNVHLGPLDPTEALPVAVRAQRKRFVMRLGTQFRGLNAPRELVLFKRVGLLNFAWEQLHAYVRGRFGELHPETGTIGFRPREELGDSWFSAKAPLDHVRSHLLEVLPMLGIETKEPAQAATPQVGS